jgi:hypothetical protein
MITERRNEGKITFPWRQWRQNLEWGYDSPDPNFHHNTIPRLRKQIKSVLRWQNGPITGH